MIGSGVDVGTIEHSLLVEVQTGTTTMEGRVKDPQKPSTVLRHIPKGLYILL